jgi:hypothetical protein
MILFSYVNIVRNVMFLQYGGPHPYPFACAFFVTIKIKGRSEGILMLLMQNKDINRKWPFLSFPETPEKETGTDFVKVF